MRIAVVFGTLVLAACGTTVVLVACSNDSSSGASSLGTNSSSLNSFCSDVCTRINSCDNTRDLQTCTSQCQNDNAAAFPKLRADIVSSVQSCFDTTDCATVLKGTALNS